MYGTVRCSSALPNLNILNACLFVCSSGCMILVRLKKACVHLLFLTAFSRAGPSPGDDLGMQILIPVGTLFKSRNTSSETLISSEPHRQVGAIAQGVCVANTYIPLVRFSQHRTHRGYRTWVCATQVEPNHSIRFPHRGPGYRTVPGYRTPVRQKSQFEMM